MKNFHQIATGIDVMPAMQEIMRNQDLWDKNTLRTKTPGTPHAEVNDIWLLFNEIDPADPMRAANDLIVRPYEAWLKLQWCKKLAIDTLARVWGRQLGRVIVTKLEPGKQIPSHKDAGAPAQYFSRYQIALQSLPGAIFTIEDEAVMFESGSAWWINNRAEHSVKNNSKDDRVVLIVDVRVD